MKIRIKGCSIRLRLTRTETALIENGVAVSETLRFGGGTGLSYSLIPSPEVPVMQARFENQEIRIMLPLSQAHTWASSEEVSLRHDQLIAEGGESLQLLVEKDFFCLKPRQNQVEDESDLFQNPNEAHGRCG
jgi:hypothetical protein